MARLANWKLRERYRRGELDPGECRECGERNWQPVHDDGRDAGYIGFQCRNDGTVQGVTVTGQVFERSRSVSMAREWTGTDLVGLSDQLAQAGTQAATALIQALMDTAKFLDRTQSEIETLIDQAGRDLDEAKQRHTAHDDDVVMWWAGVYRLDDSGPKLSAARVANESAAAAFTGLLDIATAMLGDQRAVERVAEEEPHPCRDIDGFTYVEHEFSLDTSECTRCEFARATCTGTRRVHPYDDAYVEDEDCDDEAAWMGVPHSGRAAQPYCDDCIDQAAVRLKPIGRTTRPRY